jgi:hypothetical protein
MNGTTAARERQVHLAERAAADAAAPEGATGGPAAPPGPAAPAVPAPAVPPPVAPAPAPGTPQPPPAATPMTPAQAQQAARSALARYGWGGDQFSCLQSLWNRESGWRWNAQNPSSGAYGIPQALPGSKMASAGADWRTNATTQIAWGLSYIKARYADPCGAWDHSERTGWY